MNRASNDNGELRNADIMKVIVVNKERDPQGRICDN